MAPGRSSGVHLGAIFLAGCGLAWPWEWALRRRSLSLLTVTGVATLALLAPVYVERAAYLQRNQGWIDQQAAAQATDEKDLQALAAALRKLPAGRVYAGMPAGWGSTFTSGNLPLLAYLQYAGFDMHGYLYHALSLPGDVQVLFDERRADHYRVFNVRYVVAPENWSPPSFLEAGGEFGRFRLYRAPASGYFELADTQAAFTGDRSGFYPAARAWLTGPLPAQGEYPALLFAAAVDLGITRLPLALAAAAMQQAPPPAAERGQITLQSAAAGHFQAEVEAARPLTLALKTSFHPNWQAVVDGKPVQTLMVMPGFLGVRLTEGKHKVQIDYRPAADRAAWLVFGLLVWSGAWLLERRRAVSFAGLDFVLARLPAVPHAWQTAWAHFAPGIWSALALALLAGLPLLQPALLQGHDTLEYLPRSQEYCASLQAGLVPRWAPDLSSGYGQPFFLYNPPLFYALSCGLHFLGARLIVAQNLSLLLLLWVAGLGMFLLARQHFGSAAGYAAAAAYLFAPYLLTTLYVRAALADFCAFAFIPPAFWAITRSIRAGEKLGPPVGALAVAGINLSSNPAALIVFPALMVYAGWMALGLHNHPRQFRWQRLYRAVLPLLLGLGLGAFFWLPAMFDHRLVHSERLLQGVLAYTNHFVFPQQLIYSPWGYGLSLPGLEDGMSFALGPLHLGAALLATALAWRSRRTQPALSRSILFFLGLFIAAALLTTTLARPLWDRLPLLQYLEFPWRFLTLCAVAGALLAGAAVRLCPPGGQRWLAAGIVGLAILSGWLPARVLAPARPSGYLNIKESDYAPQAIARNGISVNTANEYEPVWVMERPPDPAQGQLIFLSGSGALLSRTMTPERRTYRVRVDAAALVKAELFYFPGWRLSVDGKPQPIAPSLGNGLVSFSLPPGEHTLILEFGLTPLQLLSVWISAITGLWMLWRLYKTER